jgi:hypothetical protein
MAITLSLDCCLIKKDFFCFKENYCLPNKERIHKVTKKKEGNEQAKRLSEICYEK